MDHLVAAETAADVAWLARGAFASKHYGKSEAYVIGLDAKLDLLIAELCGPDPTPAVRLVSETVAFTWAEWWVCAALATHNDHSPMRLKRAAAAHSRFMSSLRTYTRIKQLESSQAGGFFAALSTRLGISSQSQLVPLGESPSKTAQNRL
jgi:hypothetical protein